jgi:hypothetical protein
MPWFSVFLSLSGRGIMTPGHPPRVRGLNKGEKHEIEEGIVAVLGDGRMGVAIKSVCVRL